MATSPSQSVIRGFLLESQAALIATELTSPSQSSFLAAQAAFIDSLAKGSSQSTGTFTLLSGFEASLHAALIA